MTSSPSHPSLFLSCLPPIHPSPLFFPLALPKIPNDSRTLADAFRRFFEDLLHQSEARTSVTSSSENWVKRVPCVKLMRFWVLWCHRLLGRRFSTTNQKPPFSEQLSEDFPKMLSTNQKPGNLWCHLRQIGSKGSHSTTGFRLLNDSHW